MSQYSDFFGVASSGGGASVPLNSYTSIFTVTDNQPEGFVSASGIYTSPEDSSVYLKTGEIIQTSLPSAAGPDPVYPQATYTEVTTDALAQNLTTSTFGIPNVQRETLSIQSGVFYVPGAQSHSVVRFGYSPNFRGVVNEGSISTSGANVNPGVVFAAKDSNNAFSSPGAGINTYQVSTNWTPAGSNFGPRTWSDANTYSPIAMYVANSDKFYTYQSAGPSAPVYDFVEFNNDATLNATGNTFSATVPTSNTTGEWISADTGKYATFEGSNDTYEFFIFDTGSLSMTFGDNAALNPQIGGSPGANITYRRSGTGSNATYKLLRFFRDSFNVGTRRVDGISNTDVTVGDPTARVDYDGTRKFIRIK